ncbi:MAG: hypothetical protein ACYCQJ_02615 [Nitrososphaerales archaeon]
MIQCQEKTIKISDYTLKIRELTVAQEATIKADARTYDPKAKLYRLDHASLDASIILHSVVNSTWPTDFGEMTLENIKQLPSKYFRRLLIECQKLNSIKEEVADFLDSQSSLEKNTQNLQAQ